MTNKINKVQMHKVLAAVVGTIGAATYGYNICMPKYAERMLISFDDESRRFTGKMKYEPLHYFLDGKEYKRSYPARNKDENDREISVKIHRFGISEVTVKTSERLEYPAEYIQKQKALCESIMIEQRGVDASGTPFRQYVSIFQEKNQKWSTIEKCNNDGCTTYTQRIRPPLNREEYLDCGINARLMPERPLEECLILDRYEDRLESLGYDRPPTRREYF